MLSVYSLFITYIKWFETTVKTAHQTVINIDHRMLS